MSEPLSVRLRAATADLHRRVEDGVNILRRTENEAGAIELFLRMEAFYRVLEPRLAHSMNGQISSEYLQPRRPRLQDDLDRLAPGWRPLPDLPIAPEADGWGALYVVEGAALGGQVIARHLQTRLGFRSAFFGGDGVGLRWRSFRGLLDASGDPKTLEAAVATFLAFERAVVLEASRA